LLALNLLKSGKVGLTGSTVGGLERSLSGLREVVDRSMSDARLIAGAHRRQRVRLAELMEEIEVEASLDASRRVLRLSVEHVDHHLHVDVDRHYFVSALSNLVQNALKFTRRNGHVALRTVAVDGRVRIEVEDECGGLPPGAAEWMFRPFSPGTSAQAGSGLGL